MTTDNEAMTTDIDLLKRLGTLFCFWCGAVNPKREQFFARGESPGWFPCCKKCDDTYIFFSSRERKQ